MRTAALGFTAVLLLTGPMGFADGGGGMTVGAGPNPGLATASSSSPHHYMHHGHYLQGIMAVQAFNNSLNNALQNPLDQDLRQSIDSAVQNMNSAVGAINGDLSQMSPDEAQQVQQGLAKAADASGSTPNVNFINADSATGVPGAATPASVPADPAATLAAATEAAAVPAPLSTEVVNLTNLGGDGATPLLSLASAGAPARSVSGTSAGSSGLGIPSLLSGTAVPTAAAATENLSAKPSTDALSAEDSTAKKKDALSASPASEGSAADLHASNSDVAFGIEVRDERIPAPVPGAAKKNPLGELTPTKKFPVKPVLHGFLDFTPAQASVGDAEDGDSFAEKMFGWSRIALLGFIFCIPLFMVFFLLGATARGKSIKKKLLSRPV